MSEAVTDTGPANTIDAAAEQIEALMGGNEPQEEVEVPDEAEAEEIEASAEGEEAEQAPEEEFEESPLELESFNDLVEALEVESDYLDNLKAKVKVQGEELEVTFQELKAGYQKGNDYAKNIEALKRDREAFETHRTAQMQQLERSAFESAQVLNMMEQQISAEVNSEEMAHLRQTNPNEWTARRLQFQDQLQKLHDMRNTAAQQYDAVQQQFVQEQQLNASSQLEKEVDALTKALPEWGVETQQSINNYLHTTYGYSPEELQGITDHRAVLVANKARLWDEHQAQAKETAKKVKKVPKIVKPSAKRPGPQRDALSKAKSRLKKTGSVHDAAKVIEQLI